MATSTGFVEHYPACKRVVACLEQDPPYGTGRTFSPTQGQPTSLEKVHKSSVRDALYFGNTEGSCSRVLERESKHWLTL